MKTCPSANFNRFKKLFLLVCCVLGLILLCSCGTEVPTVCSFESVEVEGGHLLVLTFTDGTTQEVFIKDGVDGENGNTPYIGENGNWWIGTEDTMISATAQDGADGKDGENGLTPTVGANGNWWIGSEDTGIACQGASGLTPYIGENGNWWIGTEDTGVSSQGASGLTPYIGENGNWWIGTSDTGVASQGATGEDLTLDDLYTELKKTNPDLSYADFLNSFMSNKDSDTGIGSALYSCMKVYAEFKTTQTSTTSQGFSSKTKNVKVKSVYTGSAVIYKFIEDDAYIITNYHVIYNSNANDDNGGKTASLIHGYLYGSEGAPSEGSQDEDGYTIYSYDEYAIPLTLCGGSPTYDIAVLKCKVSDLKAINPNASCVEVAEDYHVGETVYAVGNPEDGGMSVTRGIICVENDYISLCVDGTTYRTYRSIRVDTAVYQGNSGGGLFNARGELVGIINAASTDVENINYAIPLPLALGAAENIIHYADGETIHAVQKILLGVTVKAENIQYVYDEKTGYGTIMATIVVDDIQEGSLGEQLGLQVGDVIHSVSKNGETKEITMVYDLADWLITFYSGESLQLIVLRDGQFLATEKLLCKESMFTEY